MATDVYLECGKKRVFACALRWPGWCRSGRTEEQALAAMAVYRSRYAVVAALAGSDFPASAGDSFTVTERLPGTATTDFGAPGVIPAADSQQVTAGDAGHFGALLRASWAYFDRVVAGAPAHLRKGPRGGGRDRDKIAAHVLGAEAAYSRKLGLRLREPAIGDTAAIAQLRDRIAAVVCAPSDGAPLAPNGWPVRYAVRRLAWHVLDHAWEIEDRWEPEPVGHV